MKISGIRSQIVALPADEPLADAAENPNATRPIVTLQVETDEGVIGVGVTYFGCADRRVAQRGRRARHADRG
jgi:L-alanine-DL-glutamate epimerase-like enolase superfamily enzyme